MKVRFWILERILEIAFGTILVLIVFGPPQAFVDADAFTKVTKSVLQVLGFYAISGFFVSCVVVGLILRKNTLWIHSFRMALVFAAHVVFVVTIAARTPERSIVQALAISSILVFVANAIGMFFQQKHTLQPNA